jgi:hypothetical protein
MINNINRIGNFTSSQIYRLVGAPKPRKTYIAEKNLERLLNKSIETEAYSTDMAWGTFLEQRVNDLLGMEYELCSDQTDLHPEIACWAGSKDLIVHGVKVADIKCYGLKNFAAYTDCLLTKDTDKLKAEFAKEYWQLVSNAIINRVPKAEAITYCPYRSELDEIREMALNYSGDDAWKYRFIYERSMDGLPHLQDGGYYKNLNKFEFDLPAADIDLLSKTITEVQKELVNFYAKN